MDIDYLVSCVYKRTPVWDKRDKKHSDRHVVDRCWREISAEMNEDENKLRKKWRYLRNQFLVEHGKVPVSRTGDGPSSTYERKWPHYQSLLFLKDIVKPKSHLENAGNLSKRQIHEEYVEQSYDNQDNSNPFINAPLDFENDESHDEDNKRTNLFNQSMSHIQKKARREEDDEHLLFFKSLLPHIRKIPQERVLSFRNDIQKTVEFYAYQLQSQLPRITATHSSSSGTQPIHIEVPTVTHSTPEPQVAPRETPPPAIKEEFIL